MRPRTPGMGLPCPLSLRTPGAYGSCSPSPSDSLLLQSAACRISVHCCLYPWAWFMEGLVALPSVHPRLEQRLHSCAQDQRLTPRRASARQICLPSAQVVGTLRAQRLVQHGSRGLSPACQTPEALPNVGVSMSGTMVLREVDLDAEVESKAEVGGKQPPAWGKPVGGL